MAFMSFRMSCKIVIECCWCRTSGKTLTSTGSEAESVMFHWLYLSMCRLCQLSNTMKTILELSSVVDIYENLVLKPAHRVEQIWVLFVVQPVHDAGAYSSELHCWSNLHIAIETTACSSFSVHFLYRVIYSFKCSAPVEDDMLHCWCRYLVIINYSLCLS